MTEERRPKRVLVFPCGSEIGLELHRALRFSTFFELYGASSTSDHGEYIYQNYLPNLPYIEDERFIDAVKDIIKRYEIDFIFPAHDSVVLKLAHHQNEISATVVTSPLATCQIARSKKLTYESLQDSVRTPKIFSPHDQLPFPVFLKPDVGQGSKGTLLAESMSAVEAALKKDPSLLVLEYLPGEEYTVDCFTDRHHRLLFVQARTRSRIQNGISVRSHTVHDSEFQEFAEKINDRLDFRGVWFFQVKRDERGQLTLLEVAPRVAGTMSVSRMLGANLPLLSLFDQMNVDVQVAPNSFPVEIDRALESKFRLDISYTAVYVDFDDTIISKGRANDLLLALLYRMRNQKKKIILITKHVADIYKTLDRYAIHAGLFDEVITLTKLEQKRSHLESNSIFIDDSYSERQEILEHLGIPVFDVSEAVELL